MAASGDLDTGFGGTGVVTAMFTAGDDYGYSVAVQGDGKILVAGGSSAGDFSVLRLLPDGSPDPDFGAGGKVVRKFGQFELARGVAAVSGDKILVGGAGLVSGGSRDFAALRLLSSGAPDPDYGTDGLVTTDILNGLDDVVNGMAVDGTGRAILAGRYCTNVALVRYTAGGAPDPSFGNGGKVFTPGSTATEQEANAIAIQADGKVVVAGQSRTGSNTDVLVARYLSNGTPDPNFGSGGKTTTAVGAGNVSDAANAVTVLADGKIVVVGTTGSDYLLLRYTPGGVLDTNFGSGGGNFIDFAGAIDAGYGVAVQGDGRILVTGTSNLNGRENFALLRFTSGGGIDSSFGNGGGLLTTVTAGSDSARAIALQSDGRIVVAGWGGPPDAKDFAVARYESAGPVTLASWRQKHFGTTSNSGDAANDFDFDKDGLVNLLEFAFGQNPTLAESRTAPSGEVSGANFVSRFTAPANISGITFCAEWSGTMAAGTWIPLADSGTGREHIFSVPMAGRTTLYLRWKITAQ
jgi:uncharacterized delta-60 repeat protein